MVAVEVADVMMLVSKLVVKVVAVLMVVPAAAASRLGAQGGPVEACVALSGESAWDPGAGIVKVPTQVLC